MPGIVKIDMGLGSRGLAPHGPLATFDGNIANLLYEVRLLVAFFFFDFDEKSRGIRVGLPSNDRLCIVIGLALTQNDRVINQAAQRYVSESMIGLDPPNFGCPLPSQFVDPALQYDIVKLLFQMRPIQVVPLLELKLERTRPMSVTTEIRGYLPRS